MRAVFAERLFAPHERQMVALELCARQRISCFYKRTKPHRALLTSFLVVRSPDCTSKSLRRMNAAARMNVALPAAGRRDL